MTERNQTDPSNGDASSDEQMLDAAFADSAGQQPEPSGESVEQNPAARIEQLEKELESTKQKWLVAEAEVENTRKRAQRDLAELRKFASLPLIRELLPVIDNLGRAVSAAEQSGDLNNLLEGIRMVESQFRNALSANSATVIKSHGQPFDPNEHEAMTQVPSADHPPMTVLQVVEDGYKMHDRVIRPAKVIVSMEPPAGSE